MTIVAEPTASGLRPTRSIEIPTRTLVFGLVGEDGTILASELYPVAQACGQTAEQVRLCLRLLVAEGLFVRRGSGSDARFALTPDGMAALCSIIEPTWL